MKNFLKNTLLKIISVFSLLFLSFSTNSLSALAANAYNAVNGGKVDFEQYLIYDKVVQCPNVEFEFKIEPGNALPSLPGKQEVFSGSDNSVSGSPVLYRKSSPANFNKASFSSESQRLITVQNVISTLGQHSNLTKDPVELNNDQSYSRDEVTIDFSEVSFSEPGVYRWKITALPYTGSINIISDTNPIRYIDVYVNSAISQTNTGYLEIKGYVLHSVENFQPSATASASEPMANNKNVKAIGYINYYRNPVDLAITAKASGNQASHTKQFKYEIEFQSLAPNTKYDVILSEKNPLAVTGAAFVTKSLQETNGSFTSSANGTASYTFYLKDGSLITFKNLPHDAYYSITHFYQDYTPSLTIEGDRNDLENPIPLIIDDTASTATWTDGNLTKPTTLYFTTYRQGVIPTGIPDNFTLGEILVVFIGFFGIYCIFKRSLKNE